MSRHLVACGHWTSWRAHLVRNRCYSIFILTAWYERSVPYLRGVSWLVQKGTSSVMLTTFYSYLHFLLVCKFYLINKCIDWASSHWKLISENLYRLYLSVEDTWLVLRFSWMEENVIRFHNECRYWACSKYHRTLKPGIYSFLK